MSLVRGDRSAVGVALLIASCGLAACGNRHPGPTADAGAAAVPVDHLRPGELADGPFRAFEVKLPVGMESREAFTSVVYAWGQVDPMRLANYLRAQVAGGSVNVGAAATVFEGVTPRSNPRRVLRLRVDSVAQGRGARLEVRDITPLPVPSASSEAERWRQVGLTPDGQLTDPTHLH